ncbi:hypothetical protein [Pseudomonas sp. UMAB-08]|uniref:hypothetical protein n=1 Tax=Pseudomonas sp. UMAB-08 TaxID=1365375 RepID=UPI001C55D760|nr:hypothetical protein [Pseudomonas sp. UMAB-08]
MPVTPLPVLDRTAATFKTDTDTFFGTQLPAFSVEMNSVIFSVSSSAMAADVSKASAAISATSGCKRRHSKYAGNHCNYQGFRGIDECIDCTTQATTATTKATAASTSATNAANSATSVANSAASISSGPVTSVSAKTGVVVLIKGDIGLGSVDNARDVNKPVSAPPQLAAMHAVALSF